MADCVEVNEGTNEYEGKKEDVGEIVICDECVKAVDFVDVRDFRGVVVVTFNAAISSFLGCGLEATAPIVSNNKNHRISI
jgi:hypothetical protein